MESRLQLVICNDQNLSYKLKQELPVKYQLARSNEFFTEELDRDKKIIFGCGQGVRGTAEASRFLVRIYLLHHEKWSGHIDMSLPSFSKIITRLKNERDFVTFDDPNEDFALTVELNNTQFTFSNRRDTVISIKEKTLDKMIACGQSIVNCQYSCGAENQTYREILNLIAYSWNEKKVNDWVHPPAEWYKGGLVSTLEKLIEQIRKAKDKNAFKALSSSSK